ncbi:unnamed protein product [Bubo scandiacus]
MLEPRQRCIPRLSATKDPWHTAHPFQAQLGASMAAWSIGGFSAQTPKTLRLIKPVALLHDYHGMFNVQECARPQLNVPYEE